MTIVVFPNLNNVSEFAYDDAAAKYTEYVKGLEKDTFEKNARKEGIQVTTLKKYNKITNPITTKVELIL